MSTQFENLSYFAVSIKDCPHHITAANIYNMAISQPDYDTKCSSPLAVEEKRVHEYKEKDFCPTNSNSN